MTAQEAIKKLTESEDIKKAAIEALKAGKAEEFLRKQEIDLPLEQLKEYLENRTGELDLDELDAVAGGFIVEDTHC